MKKISDLMTVKFSVSNQTIVRILFIILAFVAGIWLVYVTRQALLLIGVAFFLALALNPPVTALSKRLPRESRGLATAVAFLAVVAFLSFLVASLVPPIVEQTRALINNLPEIINNLKTADTPVAELARRFDLIETIQQSEQQITDKLSSAGGPVLDILSRIFNSTVALLTVLVLTFFMLIEGPDWLERFWQLLPKDKRQHRKELAQKMYHVVTGYVNGQLFIAVLSGVAAYIMIRIVDVPFAAPLATVVGVFALIPLIGATLGAALVILVSLFQSLTAAIVLFIFFVAYQQFENNVIQPIVQSRSVDMSPLLVLVSAIIGITLAGLIGALIAIPVAASIRILIRDYLERTDNTVKTDS